MLQEYHSKKESKLSEAFTTSQKQLHKTPDAQYCSMVEVFPARPREKFAVSNPLHSSLYVPAMHQIIDQRTNIFQTGVFFICCLGFSCSSVEVHTVSNPAKIYSFSIGNRWKAGENCSNKTWAGYEPMATDFKVDADLLRRIWITSTKKGIFRSVQSF